MNITRFALVSLFAPAALFVISCSTELQQRPSYPLQRNGNAKQKMSGAPAPMDHEETGAPPPEALQEPEFNTEAYDRIYENEFLSAAKEPLSTFSADVDTASYSNLRRFLNDGSLPPKDAIRIEEMINYFRYRYPEPSGDAPFSVTTEVAQSPWSPKNKLLRIGIQGKRIDDGKLPPRNLVFLLDVSGSMESPDKLPLLKKGFKMLSEQLTEKDHVAIVVYAGASGLVLPPTSGAHKNRILEALGSLSAGGSTNGGEGIELAYKIARRNFNTEGINRVILATDGDFNVGTTNQGDLIRLIEKERESGIFLTVLGFGKGNLKDSTMEKLADKGNGNYAYIDSALEAKKVLVTEAGSTLVTIAKDVKFQIEFNPRLVSSYRLIGYENRVLRNEDFNDDTKDAGEIGAGHSVTALYEITPAGADQNGDGIDPLKYSTEHVPTEAASLHEIATVKIRYKEPSGIKSRLLSFVVNDASTPFKQASEDMRFASSVASFGMVLRDSKFKGDATFDTVLAIAETAKGEDRFGYRSEFLRLVRLAKTVR